MPDREKIIKGIRKCLSHKPCSVNGCPYENECAVEHLNDPLLRDALALLKEQDTCENCAIAIEDRQPVVRCKDCKHRPKEPDWKIYESGFDLEFPEGSKCPCRCSGDKWYSWYPEDDWFCADGERKEGR